MRIGVQQMDQTKNIYRGYSEYLQDKYGEKVYKLPVNLPGTCPNRDGVLGVGGCIYCDSEGAGFECLPNTLGVLDQLRENRDFFQRRFQARKFIVYFQSFTNTYMPLEMFKDAVREASRLEDAVGISISTRPDCINEEILEFLKESPFDITIELGLQTVNYRTLAKINRGHTLAEFIDAVLRIKKAGFQVAVHLILNLPWDDELDVTENARILSALDIDYVKLHSLYIVRGTVLGDLYERGEVSLCSLDDYVERVILFLENLAPQVVIQRLIGKGPREKLLFCNWNTSWWKIKDMVLERMLARGTYQGKSYDYLNGKALRMNKKGV